MAFVFLILVFFIDHLISIAYCLFFSFSLFYRFWGTWIQQLWTQDRSGVVCGGAWKKVITISCMFWIHLYSDWHTKIAAYWNEPTVFSTGKEWKALAQYVFFLLAFIVLIFLKRCHGQVISACLKVRSPEPHSVKWLENSHCPPVPD